MKAKKINETLNEISADLFKSAMRKTGEYGQHNRGYHMGQNFFRKFEGLELMGAFIKEIGVIPPQSDNDDIVVQITLKREAEQENIQRYLLFYRIEKDKWTVARHNDFDDIEDVDISRRDARILSKISSMVNEDTKYKNINKFFNVDSSYYRGDES